MKSRVYYPDILEYQVTDLIWLRYHDHMAEFGYDKYLIVHFLVRFGGISGSFGLAMGILARLRLAKIRTMARPNPPDMPPKRTKKGTIRYNYCVIC